MAKRVKEVIELITAIIALLIAAIGLYRAGINSYKIQNLQNDLALSAMSLTIDSPKEGEIINADVFDMHGSYLWALPPGHRLWVLTKDKFNYYLMYPPPSYSQIMRRWDQHNVRLINPGQWELHICIANEIASNWLEMRAKKHDWSGFSSLPDGMKTARYINVIKQE